MGDKTSLSKKYRTYFILDEGKLRKLVDVLSEYSKKKDYECGFVFTVEKSNDSEYVTDSVESVLKDDNIKRKEIRKLTISLQNRLERYSRTMECTVIFDRSVEPDSYYSPVQYSVKDDDERWAFSISEELDTYIQRTLISNSKKFKPIFSFFDAMLPLLTFLLCILVIDKFRPLRQIRVGDLNLLEVATFTALYIGLILLSFDIFSWLKPHERLSNLMKHNSVFYWGDQRELYDAKRTFRQNIKWVVIIGFLVSVMAGILVAVLLN